jgi:outer membrane receptor protein involved in Fe transport
LAPPDLREKERFRQDAYALLSARVTWTSSSEHFYVQVYGNNLTDHVYRLSYNGTAFGDYGAKAEPLTYGAKVGVKF